LFYLETDDGEADDDGEPAVQLYKVTNVRRRHNHQGGA